MRNLKVGVLVAITFGLVACDKIASYSLNGEEAKYSYAIGYQFAKNMKDQEVTVDPNALALAIKDVMGDKPTRLTEEEMQTAMKSMYEKRKEKESHAATENKKKGDEYLAANKTKEGIKTTESGLQYKIDEEGDAKAGSPTADSLVTVHYKGTLIDGKEFDSSYSRGQPANFPLGGVIPGWQEALKMMKKGAKWKIYVPPELAYGDRARPGIPANSVLVFEVNLLDIKASAETKQSTEKELKTKQKASAKK